MVRATGLLPQQQSRSHRSATLPSLNKVNLIVTASFYFCLIANHKILNESF